MTVSETDAADLKGLRERGAEAVAELFQRDREKLTRFVMHRMDPRLAQRVDCDDVLQEAYLVVRRRYDDYLANPAVPFFIWMRALTGQVLIDLHRKHLKLQVRNANREVSIDQQLPFQSSAHALQELLEASGTSPSDAMMRDEQAEELRRALDEMSEIDREVLVLRHLEQLSNSEVASILNIDKSAATKRYIRALSRLGEKLK